MARTNRRAKRSRVCATPRNSSMASAFSKTLIASSPIQDEESSLNTITLNTYEDYEVEFKRQMDNFERKHRENLRNLDTVVQNLQMSFPLVYKTKTLGEICDSIKNKENLEISAMSNDTLLIPVQSKKNTKGDGVVKQPFRAPRKLKTPASAVLKNNVNLKNCTDTFLIPVQSKNNGKDEEVFKRPLGTGRKVQTDVSSEMRTPKIFSIPANSGGTITPKINPSTPMCMMRHPKLGEVGVSMTGSPLLFSGVVHNELPTVTVPFSDGRIFSIMPNPGTLPEDAPEFDATTITYLKNLQKHLNMFCGPLDE